MCPSRNASAVQSPKVRPVSSGTRGERRNRDKIRASARRSSGSRRLGRRTPPTRTQRMLNGLRDDNNIAVLSRGGWTGTATIRTRGLVPLPLRTSRTRGWQSFLDPAEIDAARGHGHPERPSPSPYTRRLQWPLHDAVTRRIRKRRLLHNYRFSLSRESRLLPEYVYATGQYSDYRLSIRFRRSLVCRDGDAEKRIRSYLTGGGGGYEFVNVVFKTKK